MRIAHRIFVLALIVLAGIWAWSIIQLYRQDAADRAFYQQKVLPYLEEQKRQEEAFSKALEGQRKGALTPFELHQPSPNPMQELVDRKINRKPDYRLIRFYSLVAFQLVGFIWAGMSMGVRAWKQRKWEAPDRPAVPDAGARIAEQMTEGHVFVAKAKRWTPSKITLPAIIVGAGLLVVLFSLQRPSIGGLVAIGMVITFLVVLAVREATVGRQNAKREIRIDLDRAVAEFHNFMFVTSFTGNRVTERAEVPFADILGTKIIPGRDSVSLEVRTARGKVMIGQGIQPFDRLVNILTDAAELNRASADSYKNALAREPVVRTPWYGWAIIAAALAIAGFVFYRVMHS